MFHQNFRTLLCLWTSVTPVFFSQGRFDWRNPGWTPAKYAYLEALCCYLFMKVIWVNIFVPTSWKFRLNVLKWLPDPRLWRWNELRLVCIDIYIHIYMSYIFILYCMEINYISSKDTDRKKERKSPENHEITPFWPNFWCWILRFHLPNLMAGRLVNLPAPTYTPQEQGVNKALLRETNGW